MSGPPTPLRIATDNMAITLLCAALATTVKPGWLWWPLNTNWFLWMGAGLSVVICVVTLVLWAAGDYR